MQSVGELGAWGYGAPTAEGLPSEWVRRPAGSLCRAHGLESKGGAMLNGRIGVKVDWAKDKRSVVDFGPPYGVKAVRDSNLEELNVHEGAPEFTVGPEGVLVVDPRSRQLLQRMPLGAVSRAFTVDARDGTDHIVLRGFDGRASLYLQLDQRTEALRRLTGDLKRLRPQLPLETLQFWHCGGDASFGARIRAAHCRYPLQPDGRRAGRWRESRVAGVYALLCLRAGVGRAPEHFRQPSDCVLCVLSFLGWASAEARLRAEGLEGAAELNGRYCRALEVSQGRVIVAFDGDGAGGALARCKSIQPANLRRLRLDGEWAPACQWPQWHQSPGTNQLELTDCELQLGVPEAV